MNVNIKSFALYAVVIAVVAGCSSGDHISAYEQGILQARFERDMQFKDPTRTVLRDTELGTFRGLRYYDVDPAYSFEVALAKLDTVMTVFMEKQKTEPVPYRCVGHVDIPFPEGSHRLLVFGLDEYGDKQYWIPFNDTTNGKDSYGGGRYLDAPVNDDGLLLVDFNMAYNPLCNYNPDDYNCTIPPAQNRLTIPVPAGEKESQLLSY